MLPLAENSPSLADAALVTPRPESPATANCQLLYFTSSSATEDGAVLAAITDEYSTQEGGASLARIDRQAHAMEPLAIFEGPAVQAYPYFARPRAADPAKEYLYNGPVATHGLNKSSPCLHPASGDLFFVWVREDGCNQLDCVNLHSGLRRQVTEFPADRTVAYCHLDCLGAHLLVALADARVLALGAKRDSNRGVSEAFGRLGLTTRLVEVEVASGASEVRWEDQGWITHVQYHPQHRDTVLFNREWTWPLGTQRMWLKQRGEPPVQVRRPERPVQFRVSPDLALDDVAHEVWQEDGTAIIYHGMQWDAGDFPEQFVGRAPVNATAPLQEISLPREVVSFYGHFYPSATGDFVITDAVANERGRAQRKGNLISRLDMDWVNGSMRVTPLCESNASWHTQDNHPHPVLSPDESEVLFTSDGSGVRQIYSVPVAP